MAFSNLKRISPSLLVNEIANLGEAARREAVAAADARTFLEGDRPGEALRGEHLVCDLERLHKTDGTAETVSAHLQEELIGNVVVRADEQLVENLREGAR